MCTVSLKSFREVKKKFGTVFFLTSDLKQHQKIQQFSYIQKKLYTECKTLPKLPTFDGTYLLTVGTVLPVPTYRRERTKYRQTW